MACACKSNGTNKVAQVTKKQPTSQPVNKTQQRKQIVVRRPVH